jgi:lysophospholipase L1-like esterase
VDARLIAPAIANLRVMVRDARSRNIRAYLATIPPMNPAARRGAGSALVAPMNDEIRALARSEGVTLVDVHQAFGGTLSLLSSDGLHPNADGFAKISDTFFLALRGTLELPQTAPGVTPATMTWVGR